MSKCTNCSFDLWNMRLTFMLSGRWCIMTKVFTSYFIFNHREQYKPIARETTIHQEFKSSKFVQKNGENILQLKMAFSKKGHVNRNMLILKSNDNWQPERAIYLIKCTGTLQYSAGYPKINNFLVQRKQEFVAGVN